MSETAEKSGEERNAVENAVFEVPEGKRFSVAAPGVLALSNGKLLASLDQTGPDVKTLTGKKGHDVQRGRWMQGRVMASADGGASWKLSATYPFRHASLFRDGGDVYLLGEASGALVLMRSPDGGGSWSAPMELTGETGLHLTPGGMLEGDGSWLFVCQAPVGDGLGLQVFRAPRGASLMNRKAWMAGPVSAAMEALIPLRREAGFGVPAMGGGRLSWRHPVPLRVTAANGDGTGGTSLCLTLGATGGGRENWCAFVRVDPETLAVSLLQSPDGMPWSWLAMPGGQEVFSVLWDGPSRLYWLAGQRSNGGADGANGWSAWIQGGDVEKGPKQTPRTVANTKVAAMGRRRLGLWFSADLLEWRYAGALFSGGEGASGVRCDPALAVSGSMLVALCRAGGERSRNERECQRILCRCVPDFRRLAAGWNRDV